MNKSQETEILRRAAAELGTNSYCGPWLAEQIDFVTSDIRSDIGPSPTLRFAQDEYDRLTAAAKKEALLMRESAKKECEKLRSALDAQLKSYLNAMIGTQKAAIEQLEMQLRRILPLP